MEKIDILFLELRKKLYDHDAYNTHETILVSGDIQTEDTLTLRQLGRTHVLHKPFSMIDDLFPLIQTILKEEYSNWSISND